MGEMEINDCWSLLAVVKECTRKAKLRAMATETLIPTPNSTAINDSNFTHLQDNFDSNNDYSSLGCLSSSSNNGGSFDELMSLYKPFLLCSSSSSSVTTMNAPNINNGDSLINQNEHQPDQPLKTRNQSIHKKKKFEERRVRILVEEELSSDKWAWRKYGQKPIKGSPYPRNYYRCSSSKGCSARKQVEQSPTDPNTYVVTYTGTHHHPRPTLRGSGRSRLKFSGSHQPTSPEKDSPTNQLQPPAAITDRNGSESNVVMKIEDDEQDDDSYENHEGYDYEILIPNLMADSDFLMMERGKKNENGLGISKRSDPNMNMGIQEMEGFPEMNVRGDCIWNNVMGYSS